MSTRVEFEVPRSVIVSDNGGRPIFNAQRCRSCQASIVWIETAAGKRMPLSLATVRRDDARGVYLAQSHFADCPNANAHRRASP